jgi:Ser/Thr protein kinase RdoA (MazF antagonist)
MERSVAAVFRPEHLVRAAAAWGCEAATATSLGSFENYVYQLARDGRPWILRLTHSAHRSPEQVRGELDWIAHLGAHDVGVCPAAPSMGGDLIEVLPAVEGAFIAALFPRAPGERPRRRDPAVWNAALFGAWGATLGRMHRLAKDYAPAAPARRRPEWHEDDLLVETGRYLPAEDAWVLGRRDEQLGWLRSLPRERDGYGLCHADLHHGNFFVDGGRLWVFDFDDLAHHWFAYDIAVVLYHVFPEDEGERGGWEDFAGAFFRSFLEGYRSENALAASWLDEVPRLLAFRDLLMYVNLCKKRDLAALTPAQARFRRELRARLERRRSLIDPRALGLVP